MSQRILCEIRTGGSDPLRAIELMAELPEPHTPLEHLLLRGLLFDVLLGCVHHDPSSSRAESTRNLVRRILSGTARPAVLLDSPARRAIEWIRRLYARPLNVTAIAHRVGCDQTSLRRLVRTEMGLSMREFQIRMRVLEAMKMFAAGDCTLTAVARSVGYKSDKNLYRALRAITGRTPSELMVMSHESLGVLAAGILPRRTIVKVAGPDS